MATKLISLLYQEEDSQGQIAYITGATATARMVRLVDGYSWDTVSSTFVSSNATDVVLTESLIQSGLYTATIDTTSWDNGDYLFNPKASKTDHSPYGYVEIATLTNGSAGSEYTVNPAAATYCTVYAFYSDKPLTEPVSTVSYISGNITSNTFLPTAAVGIYDHTTGLIYWTLKQGATVEFRNLSRGINKTTIIPALSTVALNSLTEVL